MKSIDQKIEFLKKNKQTFDRDGWIKIENFFSYKEIKNIKKKINIFLNKNHKKYSGRDINYVYDQKIWSQINSFHKLHDCKFIKGISKRSKIINLVKSLTNSKKIILRAAEFFAKPSKFGLRSPAHQDNYYWCLKNPKALTIWIALEKSSRINGGVYYFSGSHKLGLLDHISSNCKGSSQTIKNMKKIKGLKKIYPKLNLGDCLLHDSLVVHGSNKNISSSSRKGLTFQFVNRNSIIDIKRQKKYEKSLSDQILRRKKIH